jgi:hypothetical protein
LDAYSFDNFNQVGEILDAWIGDYNNHRPHDALGGLPSRVFRAKQNQSNGLLFASFSFGFAYATISPLVLKEKNIHLMRTQNGKLSHTHPHYPTASMPLELCKTKHLPEPI